MITEQQQIEANDFRRRVKAQLALNDETIAAMAHRISYPANTITSALRKPWEFPRVIAAIKADLFGKKASRKGVLK